MESSLKFRAPGITIPLGLGIGRLVFNVLNKIEWVLATLIICNLILTKNNLSIRLKRWTWDVLSHPSAYSIISDTLAFTTT